MNKLQQYQLLSAIAAVAILLSGCGDSHPKRVPVSGRVLIDGKPVETGYIQLVPAEGSSRHRHSRPRRPLYAYHL